MNLPIKPIIAGHSEAQLSQVYDYLTSLDSTLRQGKRFGWPIDCPLLLANSTSAPGAPAIPAFVTATGLYQEIALSWDLDTNPSILDFEVARATSSGGALTIIGHTQGNCFLDTDLADGTAYFYKIQARSRDGSTYSGLSSEATATTLANDTTADAQLALALRRLQSNTWPVVAIMQFDGTAVAAGSTVFLGRDDDATETNVHYSWPVTGFVVRMDSRTTAQPGGTETFTYTLRNVSADTALTHVVAGGAGNTSGAAIGQVLIGNGGRGSIKLVTSAGAAVTNHMVTLAIRVTG